MTEQKAELEEQRAKLLDQISALEDPAVLEERTKALQDQLDAMVGSVGFGGGITESVLDGYIAQAEAGLWQIDEGLIQLTDSLPRIDEGLAQIDEGIADAERQLAEGEAELNSKRAEAEAAWIDATTQFDDLEQEMRSAWAELRDWEGYDALCNQFLVKFAPGADPEKTLEAVKAALDGLEIKDAFLYADSAVQSRINNFIHPITQISGYMPVIFFAVALVVVFLFISLMVRQCRREIGILQAMGFSKGRIRLLFCYIAFLIFLLACALGAGLGVVLARYMGSRFAPSIALPFYLYEFDVPHYAAACAMTIMVCQVAMLLGTNLISRVQPAEAMSRPAPSSGKTPALLRTVFKNAPAFFKFSLSSLLRNKLRFLYSAFCLSCTVMIIFASFSYIGSREKLTEENYNHRIRYDCEIFFSEYPDAQVLKDMAALDGVTDIQRLAFYFVDLTFNGRKESAFVNALEETSDMIGIHDEQGNALHPPREGILLERHAAENLGAQAGDTVEVDGVPMRVAAISSQNISYMHYISFAQAEALKEPYLEAVLCRVNEAREDSLIAFLKDHDDYVFSIFTRIARKGNDEQFATYDTMSYLLVGAASALGMVIIVTTARSNLLEQKRELCVLRTLGFQHSQVSRHWFMQSLLQFLVSCAVGLWGGQRMEKEALLRVSDETRDFPMVNEPWLYLTTLSVTLAFVILSHLISMRSVKRWDLVESVKDKE